MRPLVVRRTESRLAKSCDGMASRRRNNRAADTIVFEGIDVAVTGHELGRRL
jgi:hypothetical protein